MTDPLTHPGQLCTSGDRAVDLAPIEARRAPTMAVGIVLTGPLAAELNVTRDERNVLLAEVNRARVRLARYEAQEARIRALHRARQCFHPGGMSTFCSSCQGLFPCPTLAALDEPEAPT